MIKKFSLLLFSCLIVNTSSAQLPTANYNVQDSVCKNVDLVFSNQSLNANNYQWDFCMADLEYNPGLERTSAISGSSFTVDIEIVYDQGNWYGFVLDNLLNKIFRYNFGDNLENEPVLQDLGNPSNFLNRPYHVKIIENDDMWYGLIVNSGNSSLIRLTFGSGLGAPPTAVQNLGNLSSLNGPFGIEIVQENGNYIAIIPNNGNNTVSLVNFGNSLANNPTASSALSIGSGFGINGASRISIIRENDNWFGFLCSRNNKVYRFDFGETIFDTNYNVIDLATVTFPEGISIVREGLNYYGYVAGRDVGLYRLSFGESVTNTPGIELLGKLGVSDQFKSWRLIRDSPGWRGFVTSRNGGIISQLGFDDQCTGVLSASTAFEPQNVSFEEADTYVVELTVLSNNGSLDVHEDTIIVKDFEAPSISFLTENACIDNENIFEGFSSDETLIDEWNWNFGDGNFGSGINVVHQFESADKYYVTLDITSNDGCINQYSDSVHIYPSPVANFEIPSSNLCTNTNLLFENASNILGSEKIAFSWVFNEEVQSNDQNGLFLFDSSGSKEIILVANLTGCIDSVSQEFIVSEGPINTFQWVNNCFGDSIHFINESEVNNVNYSWSFGDGSPGSLDFEPKHYYELPGNYQVSLNVESALNGCVSSFEDTIRVNDSLLVSFSYNTPITQNIPTQFQGHDLTLKGDSIISWSWYLFDEIIDTLQSPIITFAHADTLSLKLEILTSQGCQDFFSDTLFILEPTYPDVSFFVQDTFCINENILVSNQSLNATSYQWDFCMEDLGHNPNLERTSVIAGSSFTVDIEIVYDQGNWYGFILDNLLSKIYRYSFGDDLENDPVLQDLGNPSSLLNGPLQSKIIKNNDVWYGFVINNGNNNLIRMTFGDGLDAPPTAVQNLGNLSSLNGPFGIEIIQENGNYIAIIPNNGNNTVSLVNFGSSLANNPTASSALSIGSGFGINGASRMSVIRENNNWFGFLCSRNNKIYRFDFGETVFDTNYNVIDLATVTFPEGISIVREGLNYYGYVAGRDVGLYRLSFGESVTNTPGVELLGTLGVSDQLKSWRLIRDSPGWRGFVTSRNGGVISRLDFDDQCTGVLSGSTVFEPQNASFEEAGTYLIELTAYSNNGNFKTHSDTVVVLPLPAPPISFTTDNSCLENTNLFTATSPEESSITEWNWSFGDASTSSDQNPTHQYDTAGVYTVELAVEAENGCSNTVQKIVPIFPPPVPDFDFDAPLPCSNTELAMINQTNTHGADTLVSYFWNFNDEFTSTAADTTLYFESGGTKAVTLSASIPGCTEEITKNIEIINGPAVSFDWSGVCLGEVTAFDNQTTGNGITSYAWDFGDGFSSNLQQPSHLYVEGGNYGVSLKVGNADGCENEIIRTVQIGNIPSANFTNELACSEQDIQFFDASSVAGGNINAYRWYHGNTLLATQRDPLLSFANSGPQNVSLAVVSNIGCQDSITKPVDVLAAPIVDIIEDIGCSSESSLFTANSTAPSGSITSNTWIIDGNVFLEDEVEYLFGGPGEYDITLISRASNLCQQNLTKTIHVYPLPTADFEFSDPCTNEDILFTSTSVSEGDPLESYTWTLGGQVISFEESFQHRIAEGGSHSMRLEVATANNCVNTTTKNIVVHQAPTASFTAVPPTGAPPLEVNFNNTSTNASEYIWDFSENNDDQDFEKNTFYVYNSIGVETATLVASNEFDCTDTARVNIELVDPVLDMSIEEVIQNVNDDKINFIIRIRNRGSLVVQNPDIKIRFNDAIEISEQVDHTFYPGSLLSYPLSFSLLNMPMDNISHICFEIATPTLSDVDILPSNNSECVNLGGQFVVVNPYPNPAVESMRIPLILPEKQDVTVRMMNSEGSVVFQQTFKDTKAGLNVIRLDVSALAQGSYLLSLSYSGQSTVKKVVVR